LSFPRAKFRLSLDISTVDIEMNKDPRGVVDEASLSLEHSTCGLRQALTGLFAAAECDIDHSISRLDEQFAPRDDQSLHDWSLRVSQDGLQIEPNPIEIWMHARDWSAPGYYLNFKESDTFGWLRAVIAEHRDSLARLIVFYSMLDIGYEQVHRSSSFQDAIENKIPVAKRMVLTRDDTIPW
jgi:hypothetical protein